MFLQFSLVFMFHHLQLWDLDDLLQNSGSAQGKEAGVTDSDEDEMDVDANPSSSNKGMVSMDVHHMNAISLEATYSKPNTFARLFCFINVTNLIVSESWYGCWKPFITVYFVLRLSYFAGTKKRNASHAPGLGSSNDFFADL